MTWIGAILVLLGGALLGGALSFVPSGEGGVLRQKVGQWREVLHDLGILPRIGVRLTVLLAAILFFLLLSLFGSLGIAAFILGFFLGPKRLEHWAQRRRLARFEQYLPEALESIASALRVGLSFPQAIQPLALDFPEPIRSVFAEALRAIQVGTPVGVALKEAGRNYPTREWWLFVEAVATLLRMGGNLAEITAKAADTLRRRQKIEERLRTLTAQGRMQAWIMGLLPVGMIFILKGIDPHIYELLVGSILGWGLLLLAGCLEFVALFLIRRILALEV